ncbi:MAG: hypothetical protein AAF518_13745 [Spirochaetota bacterium]
MSNLSIENLYNLEDSGVKTQVTDVFIEQLEYSPSVHSTFFSASKPPATPAQNANWVDDIATAMVCSSIARSSLYGFSGTVNKTAADNYWESRLTDSNSNSVAESQNLYNWAFPSYCTADGTTFLDYMKDNPKSWGEQLAAKVTETTFINVTINKLIAADPNWLEKLNLVFYKLHRLDDAKVQGVVNTWKKAFPDKAITVQWQSYNFIPHNLFTADKFIGQVNAAINVDTQSSYTSPPTGGPASMGGNAYVGHTFGKAVEDFLGGKPNQLGLTTGVQPNNVTTTSAISCFLAGTPILLSDGQEAPIEEVRQGQEVVAKDGAVSIQTEEQVITHLKQDLLIYGFNEFAPFFSGGHLFWTRDGWKALEPEIAEMENPGRSAGKLEKGDIVFRVKSHEPFAYEQIQIESFQSKSLPAGSAIYGLHLLDGPRSYHANGFCVAMNYPVLTQKRIQDGFAKLTPEERRYIARSLEPVLPLLRHAVGDFIEEPLIQALQK